MGTLASDTATLNFAFGGSSTSRMWEVKVSQIPCGANYGYMAFLILSFEHKNHVHFRPRDGCLQYHTGLTGRFTSFNFIPTGDNHLKEQKYILHSIIKY